MCSLSETICELEERLLQPEVRADAARLAPLLADGFLEFGSSGRVWTRAALLDALPGRAPFRSSLTDFHARRLGPDCVLATYRITIEAGASGRTSWRSSIWIRRAGRWQILFHQGTPAPRLHAFEISSELRASPATVWRHAVSPAGVNRELRPLLRMTFPRATDFTAGWRPGRKLFRSWLLLGGVLPIEYDDLTLIAVEPGRRILERSSLLTQREWQHERVVEATPGGCRLTDRLHFAPRIAWLGRASALAARGVFGLRHRNLRRAFGGVAS